MATFGKTTIGEIYDYLNGNNKLGCRFQLTENGDVSKISAHLCSVSGTVNVKAGIYTDNAGAPNTLQGTSAEVAVGTTPQWYDFNFSPSISLSAGYYWLSIIVSGDTRYYFDDGSVNQKAENADTYADGFSDPFGTPTYSARAVSIYATYTVPPPPPPSYTIGSGFLTSDVKCYPLDSAGPTIASGASAWAFGSWVEIVPANTIQNDFSLLEVTCFTDPAAALDTRHSAVLEVGIGASGSESFIIRIPFNYFKDSAAGHCMEQVIPIFPARKIAANSRIALRIADSIASAMTYGGCKITYAEQPDTYTSALFKTYPPSSAGPQPVSNGTAWTWGSWLELVPVNTINYDFDIYAMSFLFPPVGLTADVRYQAVIQLGIGASGSETPIMSLPISFLSDTLVNHVSEKQICSLPIPRRISANSRVAVRVANSNGAALTYGPIAIRYGEGVEVGAQTYTKNYMADILLKKLDIPKTYTGDVLLKKPDILKTYTADVLLVLVQTKTYSVDTLLKKLDATKTYSSDVLLLKPDITKTYLADVILGVGAITYEKYYSADILLKKPDITKTYSADLLLKKPDIVKTYPADVLLLKSIPKTYSVDLLLKKPDITKTYIADVIIGQVVPWAGLFGGLEVIHPEAEVSVISPVGTMEVKIPTGELEIFKR